MELPSTEMSDNRLPKKTANKVPGSANSLTTAERQKSSEIDEYLHELEQAPTNQDSSRNHELDNSTCTGVTRRD